MSELEKARAGVVLSLLTLTLTWLLMSNGDDHQSNTAATNPVLLCASTHGALCEAPVATDQLPHLGSMVVSAPRLPADLGHLVVMASRLSDDSLARNAPRDRRRRTRGSQETTVVQ